jgi:GT2 family glycosyltransferase
VSQARVLIIVPTLGNRPELLDRSVASIRAQEIASDIVIVAPRGNEAVEHVARKYGAEIAADPGSQAAAINVGTEYLRSHHEFVNWHCDDDLLEPGSLAATVSALDANPDAVVAFGWCRYIDEQDNELWISKAGSWAPRILSWGPDLIPQPGMLVRADAWKRVGGINESYRFAFDLDLLLRLKRLGTFVSVPRVVSSFRWHAESLTVSDRSTNLRESERARKDALSPALRPLAWAWEIPMQAATRVAANSVSRRARKIQVTQ